MATLRTWILLLAMATLLLFAAVELVWLYPQLPERVVTHFGLNGVGGRTAARSTFLTGQIVWLALLGLGFPALRWLVTILPASMINVPHREYWLAPARINYTRAVFGDLLLLLGVINLALLVVTSLLILRANLTPEPRLGAAVWIVLALYLAATFAAVIPTMLQFKRRPR